MKKYLCLTILALACGLTAHPPLAASAPNAAPAAEVKTSDEPKSAADKSEDKGTNPAGAFDFGGGEFPFDLMQFVRLEMDPDGLTVLTGKVHIESKDMNITCEVLKLDNKTKILIATGNPVKLDQGPNVKAQCRNLTYNLTTKSALLENDASIVQDKEGQKSLIGPADTIKIDYPPDQKDSKNAKPKISMFNRPDSSRIVEIRALNKDDGKENKSKNTRTTKATDNTLDLIKVPSVSP